MISNVQVSALVCKYKLRLQTSVEDLTEIINKGAYLENQLIEPSTKTLIKFYRDLLKLSGDPGVISKVDKYVKDFNTQVRGPRDTKSLLAAEYCYYFSPPLSSDSDSTTGLSPTSSEQLNPFLAAAQSEHFVDALSSFNSLTVPDLETPIRMTSQSIPNFDWLKPEGSDSSASLSTVQKEGYLSMEKNLMNVTISDDLIDDCGMFFGYTGFNADAVRAFMRTKEPSDEQLSKDIAQLSIIVLSRGTVVSQSGKEKMTPKAIEVLSAFMRKYSIKTGKVDKRNLKMTDITLSRVVASHPEVAYRLCLSPRLSRPVSVEFMANMGYESFNPGLRGSYVFSVLPPSTSDFQKKHAGAAAAALAYMVYESHCLKPKKGEPLDFSAEGAKCLVFAVATHGNARHEATSRQTWFDRMAINTATANSWINKFKSQFGGDSLLLSMGIPQSILS